MQTKVSAFAGGVVQEVWQPQDERQAAAVCRGLGARGIAYVAVGGGTDLLVPDRGVQGVCVSLCGLNAVRRVDDVCWDCGAGVRLPRLARLWADSGCAGMQALSGIPGTLGGALAMNAGAFGAEIASLVQSVRVVDDQGNVAVLDGEEIDWGYRRGVPAKYTVTGAVLRGLVGDRAQIVQDMQEYARRRRATQPALPSLGSVFRRSGGVSAGAYIERVGLKGYRLGDVCISDVHANFIVACGTRACADDYIRLARLAAERVDKHCGVALEYEIRILTDHGIVHDVRAYPYRE